MEHKNYEKLWDSVFYSQVISMVYCKKTKLLACGTDNGYIRVIEVDPKNPKTRIIKQDTQIHKARIMGIAIDYKRKLIFSISEDKTFKVFTLASTGILNGKKFSF